VSFIEIKEQRLRDILSNIKSKRICVFGDFYLDRYSIGIMEAISREAPIPIIRLKHVNSTMFTPGGAGNVALNLADLGACVCVAGIRGHDTFGNELESRLNEKQIDTKNLIVAEDRVTGAFEKFYASAYHSRIQQVARADTECAKSISIAQEARLIKAIESELSDSDAFIFADYAEIPGTGVITEKIIEFTSNLAIMNKETVFVGDSRLRIEQFKNMVCVPNDYEAAMATGMYKSHSSPEIDDETVQRSGRILAKRLNKSLFVTKGDKGIAIFDKNGAMTIKQTLPLQGEIDPTGAGDTVASAIAAGLSTGAGFEEVAEIANMSARVTVGKVGTTGTATPNEILATYEILKDTKFADQ
jgi:rfaE bifunctional protein kinase chain/domain